MSIDMDLRTSLIRLAYEDKDLRPHVLGILSKSAKIPPTGHKVPKDVYLRAGRRWMDALERKGFKGAVRATEIRIKRIKPGSQKAEGIAQYLKAWMKEEKLKGPKKKVIEKLVEQAEDKAHQITASGGRSVRSAMKINFNQAQREAARVLRNVRLERGRRQAIKDIANAVTQSPLLMRWFYNVSRGGKIRSQQVQDILGEPVMDLRERWGVDWEGPYSDLSGSGDLAVAINRALRDYTPEDVDAGRDFDAILMKVRKRNGLIDLLKALAAEGEDPRLLREARKVVQDIAQDLQ